MTAKSTGDRRNALYESFAIRRISLSIRRQHTKSADDYIEKGQTPRDAVTVEAYEEAGLKGQVAETKIGSYFYKKADRKDVKGFKVAVYPMEVSDIADDWPEKTQRRRVWMDFNTAANSVDEPDLKVLLSDFGTMLNEISAVRSN